MKGDTREIRIFEDFSLFGLVGSRFSIKASESEGNEAENELKLAILGALKSPV